MTAVVKQYNNVFFSSSEKETVEIVEPHFINKDCKDVIDQAKVHLMLREFSECLTTCLEGLDKCKRLSHDGICYESFVILAVQAYGEQNKWKEVLPFIDKIYGNISQCPPTVIKLCIGLLSWVKEYDVAQKQACLWLENPQNLEKEHTTVGKLVVEEVLLPQKKYLEISHFVEKMLKLNPEERKQIQNFVSEAKRYEDSKMEKFNNIKTPTKKEEEQNVMLSLIERMKAFFQSLSPYFRHGTGKVLFLGLSLYLVFLHLRVEVIKTQL
ncbi:peroxisome assembly protein 26 isoform X4 [Octopus sinensis]|uniref:Peroxisome assembly protein 26 isoform X4 n=1 Tax=Octopus sinensis TaxID=2607531 RepID=A0A7E6EYL5_9MOLL|nr:peroxisome assembly protein 26 isoform X4 [Octopus sinensis]